MYVCVCRAVTERQIVQAVAEGARCLKDLRSTLGVTVECGACARCALTLIQTTLNDATAHHATGASRTFSLAMEA